MRSFTPIARAKRSNLLANSISFSFIGQGVAANTLEIDIVRLRIDEHGQLTISFKNRMLACK